MKENKFEIVNSNVLIYWNNIFSMCCHGVMVKSSGCWISDLSSNLVWTIIWSYTFHKWKDAGTEIVLSFDLQVFGGDSAIG